MGRNSDTAHALTDRELAALEKRIAEEYRKAAEELQAKIDAYFERFKARDAEKLKLLQDGKITEQEYMQWRLAQMGRGERFEALRDRIAERYTAANEVTAAYINDTTPSIYSLNRNYAAYTIEQQTGGNVAFDLWDEQTVRRLIVEQPDLMPSWVPKREVDKKRDLAWGKKQITAQVTSGILQGESIPKIAKRLQTNIPDMERVSAVRAARTAVTGAQNAGRQDSYIRAEEMGIELEKQWIATLDGRTRHDHAKADGQTVEENKPFIVGGYELMYPGDPSGPGHEIYNCFVGETQIASDSEIVRSYKHKYSGDLVEVKTAGGVNFACTPNHPILTPCGWIAAALLNNGDDLLVTSVGNKMLSGRNPYIDHVFPRMDALHKFFNIKFGNRASALGVNFHGDISTSEVEIIAKERFLRNDRYSRFGEGINKILFKVANKAFVCKRTFMEHFRRICKSAFGHVCSEGVSLPLFWRHVPHPDIHRLRAATDRNIALPEYTINDLPAETVIRSELLNRLSGKVFLDKIISVKISSEHTHVYNLQTESGYYFVNSSILQKSGKCNGIFAIAKNCRCTTIAKVKGVDMSDAKRRARDPETGKNVVIGNMTYAEWAGWKQKEGTQR